VAVEAVRSEPLSGQFPVLQGKYREKALEKPLNDFISAHKPHWISV
jgi:hypothetical protein